MHYLAGMGISITEMDQHKEGYLHPNKVWRNRYPLELGEYYENLSVLGV